MTAHATRTELDSLGAREVPADARYGIHTARALENFPHVGQRVGDVSELAEAFGMVKLAAARANRDCGTLDEPLATRLEQACEELAAGDPALREALVVPILQGGAGTSTNMNVNEVLANRTLELLGREPGDYAHCHPNDHVNRSQSTNDVYPSALRIALALRDDRVLRPATDHLDAALSAAARRMAGVRKLGRTQMQDAVPMTVDDEIAAWRDLLRSARRALDAAREPLLEVNLGGTAIGTGLTTPDGYADRAVEHLRTISGLNVRAAENRIAATTDPTALLTLSNGLRAYATALGKVANDLRLLSSGPRAGIGEYQLPPMQAGSSMMPGKVNPVICEFANQLAFRVQGLDATVVLALDAGQLQLNAMLPTAADALLEAQSLLTLAARTLADRCIDGLAVDVELAEQRATEGLGEATMLAATAGYSAAAELVATAHATDRPPAELARKAADVPSGTPG